MRHKKEVHKLINYLADEGKTLQYGPFLTKRKRKESRAIRRQQINENVSLETVLLSRNVGPDGP